MTPFLSDSDNNLVVTILDSNGYKLEKRAAEMLSERMAQGKNKVLWWGNRGVVLKFKDQYRIEKVSGSSPGNRLGFKLVVAILG